MDDNYSHEKSDIAYVVENIPGPREQSDDYSCLVEKFNSQLIHNCECGAVCREDTCNCLKISGGINYICLEFENTLILNSKKDVNIYPTIECNELCKCSLNCGNRLVQNGPIKNLYTKTTEEISKGLGLFTNMFIKKGSFVCEYAGEILTKTEVLRRHKYNLANDKMNYIYCLNEYVNQEVIQTFIDPSMFGNIGRYINHSCDPTCKILPVRVNTPIPKLAVFSSVDILPHGEITFDYGSNNLAKPIVPNFGNRKPCLCKSKKCKKYMPYDVY